MGVKTQNVASLGRSSTMPNPSNLDHTSPSTSQQPWTTMWLRDLVTKWMENYKEDQLKRKSRKSTDDNRIQFRAGLYKQDAIKRVLDEKFGERGVDYKVDRLYDQIFVTTARTISQEEKYEIIRAFSQDGTWSRTATTESVTSNGDGSGEAAHQERQTAQSPALPQVSHNETAGVTIDMESFHEEPAAMAPGKLSKRRTSQMETPPLKQSGFGEPSHEKPRISRFKRLRGSFSPVRSSKAEKQQLQQHLDGTPMPEEAEQEQEQEQEQQKKQEQEQEQEQQRLQALQLLQQEQQPQPPPVFTH